MSIESVMLSNHLIPCHPLLLPSVFLSIRVFSNESPLCLMQPKYWSFSFSTVLEMNIQGWVLLGLTGLILWYVFKIIVSPLRHNLNSVSLHTWSVQLTKFLLKYTLCATTQIRLFNISWPQRSPGHSPTPVMSSPRRLLLWLQSPRISLPCFRNPYGWNSITCIFCVWLLELNIEIHQDITCHRHLLFSTTV